MQLVAYGAQDIYLTGNPQITFFKVVYRRHTNFSMECIQQTMSGTVADSGNSTVTISRNGDLVSKIYVTESSATDLHSGTHLISEVELEIGGQRIDRQTREWMNIWTELTTPPGKARPLKIMQLDMGHKLTAATSTGVIMAQIPLQFWFCRNPGLALPLIALQYHEVKLKFTWGAVTTSVGGVSNTASPIVWCDYIYLDTDERRRFAQVSHEYLIEQVQIQSLGGTLSQKLNFNHPVKELIWTTPPLTSDSGSSTLTSQLQLNGHDRFSAQEDEYFLLRQPYDYHTNVPHQNLPAGLQGSDVVQTTGVELLTNVINAAAKGGTNVVVPANTVFIGNVNTLDNGDDTAFTAGTYVIGATASAGYIGGGAGGVLLLPSALGALFEVGKRYRIGVAGAHAKARHARAPGHWFNGQNIPSTKRHPSSTPLTLEVVVNGNFIVSGSGTADATHAKATDVYVNIDTVLATGTSTTGAGALGAGHFSIVSLKEIHGGTSGYHEASTSKMTERINVYSFALKPEEHQPSGTCNFSRIDNAKLIFTGTAPTSTCNVYAVNYNVLRIMSGMGGLAYSN